MSAAAPATDIVTPALPRHRGLITASVVLGSLLYSMDWTIGVVALPHMQALLATQDQISWVITSYIVASAIMIPPVVAEYEFGQSAFSSARSSASWWLPCCAARPAH